MSSYRGDSFLLEIGTEEIPARMIRQALEDLKALLCKALEEQRLPFGEVETFGTPRRLGILVHDLAERQEDREEIVYGPPKKQALDEGGNFTKAALGFARARGVAPEKLEFFSKDNKGECVGLRAVVRGKSAVDCLSEMVPSAVQSMTFPKMMRWGTGTLRFVRPIRNLLALYGPAPVPILIAGVTASRETFGHRFLGAGRVPIAEPGSYESALRGNSVLARSEEREKVIRKGLQEKAAEAGGVPFIDAELLEEVVFSTEYPVVVCGKFDERFLGLPKEILITSMKEHQNDFPVLSRGQEGAGLLSFFLSVLDIPDAKGEIVRGNERVLHARLSDAAFFLEEDKKATLEARTGLLDKVLFLEKLGSYREKTVRMEGLASFLARSLGLDEENEKLVRTACRLCKCDLTTEIVGEFPSLQGVAGGIYAREEGYPEAVWRAIDEHYLPTALDGKSPTGIFGGIVSIADKADLIAGCFGLGAEPSGTKDPYGLRRAAQGICKIILDQRLTLSCREIFEESLRLYGGKIGQSSESVLPRIQAFFENRLKFIFEKGGHRYDTVHAALKAGMDDILDAASRTVAISTMRGEENFEALITAYKRVANIIRGVEPAPFEPGLLRESAEVALYEELSRERPALERNIGERRYTEALKRIAALRPSIDRFFDQVLVMDPDEKLKRNRISLLQSISSSFSKIADFSLIVEEGGERRGDGP